MLFENNDHCFSHAQFFFKRFKSYSTEIFLLNQQNKPLGKIENRGSVFSKNYYLYENSYPMEADSSQNIEKSQYTLFASLHASFISSNFRILNKQEAEVGLITKKISHLIGDVNSLI